MIDPLRKENHNQTGFKKERALVKIKDRGKISNNVSFLKISGICKHYLWRASAHVLVHTLPKIIFNCLQ